MNKTSKGTIKNRKISLWFTFKSNVSACTSDITCISDIQGNRIREKLFAKKNNENNCHIHNGCSCFLPHPLMCWKNNMPRHPWLQQLGARVVSLHAAFTYHSRHFKKLVVTNLTMTILDGHTSDTPTKGKRHTHKRQVTHPQRESSKPTKGKRHTHKGQAPHRSKPWAIPGSIANQTGSSVIMNQTGSSAIMNQTRALTYFDSYWLILTHNDSDWLLMPHTDSHPHAVYQQELSEGKGTCN